MDSMIELERRKFHLALLAGPLTVTSGVPSFADVDNAASVAIAKSLVTRLGTARAVEKKEPGQKAGTQFENCVEAFVSSTFPHFSMLRPGNWKITKLDDRGSLGITQFEQFEHLRVLIDAVKKNKLLASAIGMGYLIKPDVVVTRYPVSDSEINVSSELVDRKFSVHSPIRQETNQVPLLHASISCKWTIRADRAQNSRSEALNLLRNRNGQAPHIVVVTAEPLPSRISSLAQGTGDVDCVYHFALNELLDSIRQCNYPDALDLVENMILGKRLKDISDLPLDLCV